MIIRKIKHRMFVNRYRKANRHNTTFPVNTFDTKQLSVGNATWGGIKIINYDPTHINRVLIGSFCSIASEVTFLLGGNHRKDRISTFLFQQAGLTSNKDHTENIIDKGDIVIEDDVWIGYDCLILPGTHIERGCIIGARSVVSGLVPAYSVYAGTSIKSKRFEEDIIQELTRLDYLKINKILKDNPSLIESYFYSDVSLESLSELNIILENYTYNE